MDQVGKYGDNLKPLELILEHKGEVAIETIDMLLAKLKALPAYRAINQTERKRIYSIIVECIENINKHTPSEPFLIKDKSKEPYLYLVNNDDEYVISTGNVISNERIDHLQNRLLQINQQDKEGLKATYENIIDREFNSDDGSGLGLITIGLKAKNKIRYRFTVLNDRFSWFEMKITV